MVDITKLLENWDDPETREEIVRALYPELSRIAKAQMMGESPAHTLQPTAIVHEAYLRLVRQRHEWKSREHFCAIAAGVMRRVLVDHARRRSARKRGGGAPKVTIERVQVGSDQNVFDLVAIDEALEGLEKKDPRLSRIVELRIFGGLTNPEVASVVGLSLATVKRELSFARLWLSRRLAGPASQS